MLLKIYKFVQLIGFRIRYPQTLIIGGPKFLRYIGKWRPSLSGFYSQEGQDIFIESEFSKVINGNKFPKLFLDIGCNHPINLNNSYHFERNYNFKVLAVDALDTFKSDFEVVRPAANLQICAVGDFDGSIEFDEIIGDGIANMYSSISGGSNKANSLIKKTRIVNIKTINNLLMDNGWVDIGIMRMDIEGYEKQALLGIDFSRVKFRIILIENNSENYFGDHAVREILAGAGYIFYARFWGLDDLYIHSSVLPLL